MFRIYPGALSPIPGQAPKKLWRSMLTIEAWSDFQTMYYHLHRLIKPVK